MQHSAEMPPVTAPPPLPQQPSPPPQPPSLPCAAAAPAGVPQEVEQQLSSLSVAATSATQEEATDAAVPEIPFFLVLSPTLRYYFSVDPADTVSALCESLADCLTIHEPFALFVSGVGPMDKKYVHECGLTRDSKVLLTMRYLKTAKLGEGTYASVFAADDTFTGDRVALKRLKNLDGQAWTSQSFLREVAALQELKHPNVVYCKDVMRQKDHLTLVLEFMASDLGQYLRLRRRRDRQLLPALHVASLLHMLLSGLEYCHNKRIIHRDLKPANILVSGDGSQLKITDFGLARFMQYPLKRDQCTPVVATLFYRAPDLLLGARRYSPMVDMWSVGAIFAEMSSTGAIFADVDDGCDLAVLFAIFRLCGTPNENTWAGVSQLPYFQGQFPQWRAKDLQTEFPNMNALGVDLLGRMLQMDPEKRVSPAEVCWLFAFFVEAYFMFRIG